VLAWQAIFRINDGNYSAPEQYASKPAIFFEFLGTQNSMHIFAIACTLAGQPAVVLGVLS
jgi:hypothetical protein